MTVKWTATQRRAADPGFQELLYEERVVLAISERLAEVMTSRTRAPQKRG